MTVHTIYRRVVPAGVRARVFTLRKYPTRWLSGQWSEWVEQPLGPELDPVAMGRHRRRYRSLRRLLVARAYRRYRRDYSRMLLKDTGFRLAATAARYYTSEDLLENHVMYESYNCRDFAGNPYAMFRYLIDHPDYAHLHHVIAVDDLANPKVAPYRSHRRVKVVLVHSDEFIRYAESCKYYINNASFKPYLIKRPGQVYFTTWHSTLLKKLAKDAGRPWDAANVSRALVASDIHLSPNAYTTEHLFRSHSVDGLVRGRVYEMGYPRNDLTINADRAAVRARLGVADDHRIAVYAPTWRGDYVPEDTAQSTLDAAERLRSLLPPGYVLLVKFHTLVYKFVDESTVSGVVPRDVDTNELLGVTDLLVTDYSGIFFDYLLTGNPVLFYTPDRTIYAAAKQGFYLDLEELPGPVCDDMDALADALQRLPDIREEYATRYAEFVQRFLPADDGKVCERAVQLLFGRRGFDEYLSSAPGATPTPGKRDVLLYPANLAGNGVTESFIALTKMIDHDRFNAVVLLPSVSKYRETQQRLPAAVKIFYQNAPDGYLEREYRAERAMTAYGIDSVVDVPTQAFRRTMRRIFGDLDFDAVVNYNGYFPNAAAKLATGVDARTRLIYLHNDLEPDRTIKHGQLISVFSLYRLYDRAVCVSEDSLASNRLGAARRAQYVFGYDVASTMTFARNVIVPEEIERRGRAGEVVQVGDRRFLLFTDPDEITTSGIEFDPAKKTVVCVGRLSPEKNHARLLRAFREVVDRYADARLYVIGTGKLAGELQGLAESLGLRSHVVFTGQLANPLPFVARAQCFVLASDIEGQPITILEALVLGTPVVATDIPGPRDLLAGGRGVLVPPESGLLADAICEQLAGTASAPTFDADDYVREALDEFYANLP